MKSCLLFIFVLGLFASKGLLAAEAKVELNEQNIEQALLEREQKSLEVQAPEVDGKTKESEIAVSLDSRRAGGDETSPLARMILGMCVVGGLAFAGWFAARQYRVKNRQSGPEVQMKVLSQHHLGPKKSLAVIRVAGESVLIGITDHHISLIKSLALLDEDLANEETTPPTNFKTALKNSKSNSDDDFAITGLRDFVSGRLKNMRNLE
jgi:flagellar protein FliO/FliZ